MKVSFSGGRGDHITLINPLKQIWRPCRGQEGCNNNEHPLFRPGASQKRFELRADTREHREGLHHGGNQINTPSLCFVTKNFGSFIYLSLQSRKRGNGAKT